MRSRILIPWLSLVLLLSPFLAGEKLADDELTIGRMRVMIWPEHDEPSILVVSDGRFAVD